MEAERLFTAALDPDDRTLRARALAGLGEIAYSIGDARGAVALLEEAAETHPQGSVRGRGSARSRLRPAQRPAGGRPRVRGGARRRRAARTTRSSGFGTRFCSRTCSSTQASRSAPPKCSRAVRRRPTTSSTTRSRARGSGARRRSCARSTATGRPRTATRAVRSRPSRSRTTRSTSRARTGCSRAWQLDACRRRTRARAARRDVSRRRTNGRRLRDRDVADRAGAILARLDRADEAASFAREAAAALRNAAAGRRCARLRPRGGGPRAARRRRAPAELNQLASEAQERSNRAARAEP